MKLRLMACNEQDDAALAGTPAAGNAGAPAPEDVVLLDASGQPVESAANASAPLVPAANVHPHAANASAALAGMQNVQLTSFAVGYPRDPLVELADFLAPQVAVPVKFSYATYDKRNAYAELSDDQVGMNGLPPVVQFDPASLTDATLVFRGAETPFTQQERDIANAIPGGSAEMELQDRVSFLVDAIRRGRIKRVITAAAAAAGAATGKTWDANANPIQDLYDYITAIANFAGGRQNVRLVFGATAWSILRFHAKLFGGTNYPAQLANMQTIADLIEVPAANLHVSYLQAVTSKQGKTVATGALFTAAEIYIFAATANPNRRSPDFLKTFVMTLNGQPYYAYSWNPHPLVENHGVAYYEKVAATNSSAVTRLSISDS